MVMVGKVVSQAIHTVTMFAHCSARHRLTRPGLKTRPAPYQIRLAPYQIQLGAYQAILDPARVVSGVRLGLYQAPGQYAAIGI